jgi:hypothetical protein
VNKNIHLQFDGSRRRWLAAGVAWPALAWTGAVRAQAQPPKIFRIGVLHPRLGPIGLMQCESLREGLRDLGYPGDLPIERATTFDLVINSKTAKALRVTIPQSILVRANRVNE